MPVYNGVDCFTKANLRNVMDIHRASAVDSRSLVAVVVKYF